MKPKRPTPRHITINMPKVKDKGNVKSSKRKAVSYLQGSSHNTDFSTETVLAKRDCQEISKVMKSKDLQPRLIYPEKLSFRIKKSYEELPRQEKAKAVHYHQISNTRNVKGSSLRRRKNIYKI